MAKVSKAYILSWQLFQSVYKCQIIIVCPRTSIILHVNSTSIKKKLVGLFHENSVWIIKLGLTFQLECNVMYYRKNNIYFAPIMYFLCLEKSKAGVGWGGLGGWWTSLYTFWIFTGTSLYWILVPGKRRQSHQWENNVETIYLHVEFISQVRGRYLTGT